MVVSDLIQQAYAMASGKSVAPTVGTTKYNKLLLYANIMQNAWQQEPGFNWENTYAYTPVGTVSETDTFDLDLEAIRVPSQRAEDYIIIRNASDQDTYYQLVSPSLFTRDKYQSVATIIDGSLVFPTAFAADSPHIGSTILMPGYLWLEELVNANDEIQVLDPNWLVYMTAAEYARNDLLKQNQYGNLVAYAENSMNKMKEIDSGPDTGVYMEPTVMGESWGSGNSGRYDATAGWRY